MQNEEKNGWIEWLMNKRVEAMIEGALRENGKKVFTEQVKIDGFEMKNAHNQAEYMQ